MYQLDATNFIIIIIILNIILLYQIIKALYSLRLAHVVQNIKYNIQLLI